MSIFGQRHDKPPVPPEVEPFDQWELRIVMSDGSETITTGYASARWTDEQRAECLRVGTAMRDGLVAAGFDAELTLIRKQVEKR